MHTYRATTRIICSIILFLTVHTATFSASAWSREEILEFGSQLQNSLVSENPYYFNLSFDKDQLLNNVFSQYGQSPDASFHKGFIDGIKNNLDLGNLLIGELQTGGSIELISVRTDDPKPSIIFRLINTNGINYHEYFIEKVDDKLKLTDVYIYSTGQLISETVGDLYVSSWFNIQTDYTLTIDKINSLKSEGKYRKAFHKWDKLPENTKMEKSNLLTGVELASRLDAKTFFSVYNFFSLYYPEEPGKYLIPVDGLIASGLYETALQNIDSLDRIVQNDPLLNFVRANICYVADKIDRAEYFLYQLIAQMPDFELGYFSLLDLFLQESDYLKATDLLTRMMETFNNYKEDYIPLFANYPEFVSSPEYRDWMEQ